MRSRQGTVYSKIIKPFGDRLLGIVGLIVLSWLFLIIAIAIKIDDPGPVMFRQKRVGRKKNGELTYFNILKFRTMRVDAPKDMPTHLFTDSEQYITRVGRFLRRTSLDELPQLWNIGITHDISIVGPRPALWNQYDLIEERERYGVNDITPGLTGLAQISGRDELEIAEKARLDGVYTEALNRSSAAGWKMDMKCFFGTIRPVAKGEGIVDGLSEKAEDRKAE